MAKSRARQLVDENDPGFCRFWAAYPRHVSKLDARKAWAALSPSPELVETIVAALEWQVPAFKWNGASADFAPYPASWLNAQRWTDERRGMAREERRDIYGHCPPCSTYAECIAKVLAEGKRGAHD